MAGNGTRATTYIITKMACDVACEGLIPSFFDLAMCGFVPPVVPVGGYHSMGSIPLAPGEIHNVFQPVNLIGEHPYLVPVDRNFEKNKIVIITVEIENHQNTMEVGVNPNKPSKDAISVLNAENVSRSMKAITIENLGKKATKASVAITKVRRILLIKNK